MGVDLSIVDLINVEPILVVLNTVEVSVVDAILCRTYSVCRLGLILQVLLCAPVVKPVCLGFVDLPSTAFCVEVRAAYKIEVAPKQYGVA